MKPHLQIALAIIWRGPEILIARRRDDADHLPGVWEFPGGKCRDGETPNDAAIREAREELGVEIRITGTRPVLEFDYETRHVTLHPFDAEIFSGEGPAMFLFAKHDGVVEIKNDVGIGAAQ